MKRRTLLATAGSVLLATAGCTTNSDANGENPDDTNPDGDTPGSDAPDGDTPDRDPDEGDAVGAVFEDCPSFADDVDRTVCAHTEKDSDVGVYPTVSQEVFTPTTDDGDVETMQITVHNETGGQVGLNPYAWQLHERTDDSWTSLPRGAYPEPWHVLESGQTYAWELGVESRPSPQQGRTLPVTEDLESGTYALQIIVLHDEPSGASSGDGGSQTEPRTECVAQFRVSRS